mmetsp:Transcript_110735/g.352711  ORF Transcript_110735/g.352711 Transcript_110735/m.352711 type:complete len:877 (-) Transcript_110735:5495-8125(-)
MSARVSGRVARAQELHALDADPLLVGRAVEAAHLGDLTDEHDDPLCAVLVLLGQVALVAEHNNPPSELQRTHDQAARRLNDLAVGLEGLEQQLGRGPRGEVQGRQLKLTGHSLHRGHQCHRLAAAWRPAQDEGPALLEPRGQRRGVAHGVDGGDDERRVSDLVWLNVQSRHALGPMVPLAILHTDLVVQKSGVAAQAVGHRNRPAKSRGIRAELHSEHQMGVAREGPAHREDQVLLDEGGDDVLRKREVLMVLVVLNDHVDALADQGEQARERPDRGEDHDVLHVLGELQEVQCNTSRLEQGPQHVRAEGLRLLLLGPRALFALEVLLLAHLLSALQVAELDLLQLIRAHHLGEDDILGEPDHAATRDRGERRVLERVHLEHDADIRRDRETLAVRQGQQLVVVKDRVQVLGPLGINVAVEHDPLTPVFLAARAVAHAAQDVREDAIRPLEGGGVQLAVQLLLADGLGVHDVGVALDAIDLLHGVEERSPDRGLAGADGADKHDAMGNPLDLVQLHALEHEVGSAVEVAQPAEAPDLVLEHLVVHTSDLGAREDTADEAGHQRLVLGHEFRHQGVVNGAQQNRLLADGNVFLGHLQQVRQADRGDRLSFHLARTCQHCLQRTQTEVVVRLRGELVLAKVEQKHDLARQALSGAKALVEQIDLRNERLVRRGHGHGSEELLQVVRQVRAAGVAGVHRHEDTDVGVEPHRLAQDLDLLLVLLVAGLDRQDLFTHRRQDPLLKTVELVKAAPSADLAEADEDAAHGLEVETLVAAEDKHEAAHGAAQGLHGLRLACACRTEGVGTEPHVQRLRERQEAAVCKRCLHELVGDAQVLEAVEECGICHADRQLLKHVLLLGVEVHAHHLQPLEVPVASNLVM